MYFDGSYPKLSRAWITMDNFSLCVSVPLLDAGPLPFDPSFVEFRVADIRQCCRFRLRATHVTLLEGRLGFGHFSCSSISTFS